MTVLLASTAYRLYWAARYLERAEDMARIIRSYHELIVDLGNENLTPWEPLAASTGVALASSQSKASTGVDAGETIVCDYLIADRDNQSSIVNSVARCRENLRVTREVMPREAWQVVNSLSQFVSANAAASVGRQRRSRFLDRVIEDGRRFEGVIAAGMTRNDAYRMVRLGRLLERADMTTRVLGVRAAALLEDTGSATQDAVQWMGVLRSMSALQMYQRATRGPISGPSVTGFLLHDDTFPRSIYACLNGMRTTLADMPMSGAVLAELDRAQQALRTDSQISSDGVALDAAMDRIQGAVAAIDQAIFDTYIAVGDDRSQSAGTAARSSNVQ